MNASCLPSGDQAGPAKPTHGASTQAMSFFASVPSAFTVQISETSAAGSATMAISLPSGDQSGCSARVVKSRCGSGPSGRTSGCLFPLHAR